jgi:hypothetical protein
MRRSALTETLTFLIAVVGVNLILGDGNRYISMTLHPFWIIVLLISVQYGSREGLAAAFLSTVFLLVGNLPEQSLSETMYGYLWHVCREPVLWFTSALILGGIRARQIDERGMLLEQMNRAHESLAAIIENYKIVKQSKEQFELRLAEERRSVLTVYDVACELETLDPNEAAAGIERLIAMALSPQKFSLYVWHKDGLSLKAAYGWRETDRYAKRFDRASVLAGHMRKAGAVLSVANEKDEKILGAQGILAGPIVDARTGHSFGMLKIEEIAFTDMDIRTYEIFRILCAWIARVYTNVEAHKAAKEIPALHPAI